MHLKHFLSSTHTCLFIIKVLLYKKSIIMFITKYINLQAILISIFCDTIDPTSFFAIHWYVPPSSCLRFKRRND
jgi:hypothetical protein